MKADPAAATRQRHDFSRIRAAIALPDLIAVQRRSYDRFLQKDFEPEEREDIGLQHVFRSVFPIKDFRENCELDFLSYTVGEWAWDCLLYTSPSPRDATLSRMPSSA